MKTRHILKLALLFCFASFFNACSEEQEQEQDENSLVRPGQVVNVHQSVRKAINNLIQNEEIFKDTQVFAQEVFPVMSLMDQKKVELQAQVANNGQDTLLMSSSDFMFKVYEHILYLTVRDLFELYQNAPSTDSLLGSAEVRKIYEEVKENDAHACNNLNTFVAAYGLELDLVEPLIIPNHE